MARIRFILFILILFPVSLVVATCSSSDIRNKPILDVVELQGHRGARGLVPENSLPSFKAAIDYGMNVIELDTVVTGDKELVVHHDTALSSLCRDKDGRVTQKVPISKLKLSEVQALVCGADGHPDFPEQKKQKVSPPSLDQFFEYILSLEKADPSVKKIGFNIELKFPKKPIPTPADLRTAAGLAVISIKKYNMSGRTTLQSFRPAVLPEIAKLDPTIKRSALFVPTNMEGLWMILGGGDSFRREIILEAKVRDAHIISPYHMYVTPEFVAWAHRRKLAVIVWTVNEKELMHKLLDMGVDGVITDYPDRLQAVVKERGKKSRQLSKK